MLTSECRAPKHDPPADFSHICAEELSLVNIIHRSAGNGPADRFPYLSIARSRIRSLLRCFSLFFFTSSSSSSQPSPDAKAGKNQSELLCSESPTLLAEVFWGPSPLVSSLLSALGSQDIFRSLEALPLQSRLPTAGKQQALSKVSRSYCKTQTLLSSSSLNFPQQLKSS